jgi:hypothetical protein
LATEVNKHRSLSSLKRSISELRDSLDNTQESLVTVESEIKIRKVQFEQLLSAIVTMETKLFDDEDKGGDDNIGDVEDDGDENHRSDDVIQELNPQIPEGEGEEYTDDIKVDGEEGEVVEETFATKQQDNIET